MIDTRIAEGGIFPTSINKDQARDTGMAMVLICLLLGLFSVWPKAYLTATILLVVTMTAPTLFKPVAILWLGLSHLLGTVMSKILLSIVFFVVVTPMALIRRMLGKDSLALRRWKKDDGSAFVTRDHSYAAKDIEQPF